MHCHWNILSTLDFFYERGKSSKLNNTHTKNLMNHLIIRCRMWTAYKHFSARMLLFSFTHSIALITKKWERVFCAYFLFMNAVQLKVIIRNTKFIYLCNVFVQSRWRYFRLKCVKSQIHKLRHSVNNWFV